MSEVETSIDIAAPPEHVWKLAMDPERLADWVTIHRRLHDHSGGRLRRGYEMEQTLHLRGVNFKVHWELVQCDRPFHAEWHGRGPARSHAETEYRLTANESGGTHFGYRNVFRAPLGPLGAIASRALVGGLPKREADASLARLKALVERDGR
jgi:carbon monoxide dehydrogenase subunit G